MIYTYSQVFIALHIDFLIYFIVFFKKLFVHLFLKILCILFILSISLKKKNCFTTFNYDEGNSFEWRNIRCNEVCWTEINSIKVAKKFNLTSTKQIFPLQLLGAFGWSSYLWAVLPGVPRHWRVPPASGGLPPGFYHLQGVVGGGFISLKRGMPTEPKVFLTSPDACGLRPCDRTHLKNGLVPHSCVGGTEDR